MAIKTNKIRFLKGRKYRLAQRFFKGLNLGVDAHLTGENSFRDISNFKYSTGALTHSRGIKRLLVPTYLGGTGLVKKKFKSMPTDSYAQFMSIYRYTINNNVVNRLVACGSNGDIIMYELLDPSFSYVYSNIVKGKPTACNYNYNGDDVLMISSKEGGLYMFNGTSLIPIESSPAISSVCVHKERIFAVLPSKIHSIWFSEEFNPTNWNISLNEAGFINFADELGSVLKVLPMSDFLLIFREYGINKLYATGAQEDFYLTQLYNSPNKIFESSIAVSDNFVFFATQSNLMQTEGHSVRIIIPEIEDIIKKSNFDEASACFCKNEYYLALRCEPLDEKTDQAIKYNDTLIIINMVNGGIEILKNLDICCMNTISTDLFNTVCLQLRDKSYRGIFLTLDEDKGVVLNYAMKKTYSSGIFNMADFSGNKILDSIQIYTKYDIEIELNIDNELYKHQIKGGGYRDLKIGKFFHEFSYKIISHTEKAYILPPVFNFTKY